MRDHRGAAARGGVAWLAVRLSSIAPADRLIKSARRAVRRRRPGRASRSLALVHRAPLAPARRARRGGPHGRTTGTAGPARLRRSPGYGRAVPRRTPRSRPSASPTRRPRPGTAGARPALAAGSYARGPDGAGRLGAASCGDPVRALGAVPGSMAVRRAGRGSRSHAGGGGGPVCPVGDERALDTDREALARPRVPAEPASGLGDARPRPSVATSASILGAGRVQGPTASRDSPIR